MKFIFYICRFIISAILTYFLYYLIIKFFDTIFQSQSLIFPYAVHPFDICTKIPVAWHYIKLIFKLTLFSNLFTQTKKSLDYYINNFEDEVFVYAYKDNNSYTISKSNLENLKYYQEVYSDLKDKKIEQITNAYSIPHSTEPLYIYFPKDKVNVKENEKIFLHILPTFG